MSRRSGPLADRVAAWPRDTTELSIVPGKLGNDYCIDQIDPHAALDWEALDRYPKLYALGYEGTDATLIAWLAKRKSVTALGWDGPGLTGVYDFRRTHLTSLGIQPTKSLTVRLSARTTTLHLLQVNADDRVRVDAPRDGAGLTLSLSAGSARPPRVPDGVGRIKALRVSWADRMTIKSLLGLRELASLSIGGDPAVAVPDPQHLAKLPKLRELELEGAYDLDVARIPELPALRRLVIDGTTKESAAILRARFATIDLEITSIKTLAWVRENLGNPFRDWSDDHGARIAAIAKRAWKLATAKPLDAHSSLAAVTSALKPFVAVFNRLADVDTIMREEIYDAFCALVPAQHQDSAEALFDALRDF